MHPQSSMHGLTNLLICMYCDVLDQIRATGNLDELLQYTRANGLNIYAVLVNKP